MTTHLRLFLICFVAFTASLPMAWISLGKVVLFGISLIYLVGNWRQNDRNAALPKITTVPTILLTTAAFGLSVLWSEAVTFSPSMMRATLSVVAVMVVARLLNSSLYDALIGNYFWVTLGILLALWIRDQQRVILPSGSPVTREFA